jgi:hypothetical protein
MEHMGNGLSKRQGTMILQWQLGMCDVEKDLKKMKVKGWIEKMRNREQWRLVVEETKAHPGL